MKTSVRGNILSGSLFATALIGFLALASVWILPFSSTVVADMRLSPTARTIAVGEQFDVSVIVEATVPVNVFAGDLTFDANTLAVEAINYNTSIADLWAEEPWYSNGDGTLNFAGGTTHPGGFTGTDTLLTITFKTLKEGAGALVIKKAQILKHDGLGTNAELAPSIDALFTVADTQQEVTNFVQRSTVPTTYAVVPNPPSTDLNGDGKQSIADTSIFLLNMGGNEARFDFNLDGKVDLKDFNIILGK